MKIFGSAGEPRHSVLRWRIILLNTIVFAVLTAGSFVGALAANVVRREGWAFIGTAAAIALAVVTLFTALYPNVMPSSTDPTFSLTIHNASSTDYTLTITTVVAVISPSKNPDSSASAASFVRCRGTSPGSREVFRKWHQLLTGYWGSR